MSVPKIPKVDLKQSFTDLLESIALEETALAHYINAEAEKVQQISNLIERHKCSPEMAMKLQDSIRRSMRLPIKKQMLLQFKMEDILEMLEKIIDVKDDDCMKPKVSGICDVDKHKDLCGFPCTEFIKEIEIKIPKREPEVKELEHVCVETEVVSHKTIRTIEGFKTIVCGELNVKIIYVTDEDCEKREESYQTKIPFCTFIRLPKKIKVKCVKPLTEDISAVKLGKRRIWVCVLLIVCALPFDRKKDWDF